MHVFVDDEMRARRERVSSGRRVEISRGSSMRAGEALETRTAGRQLRASASHADPASQPARGSCRHPIPSFMSDL